ncbi:MAG: hypothetical protein A3F67_03470 [Verrucomicrobia bacterium RIFCSPHIGHO2_12_FULL_41_10]|nr:MAG: hypothetical protein A3F67_03470 [Verrucomicrobia bacterium RIFCSPHIGHO2_12_FULL_41_10]HLB34868.1 hypothetical protein [Chthoniobacterales bacterium]
MHKKLLATLLAAVLTTGVVSVKAEMHNTPVCASSPSACSPCTKKRDNMCCAVLTKEERCRLHAAKAAAIAANPCLSKKRCGDPALRAAMIKQDPSVEPILDKIQKHCDQKQAACSVN